MDKGLAVFLMAVVGGLIALQAPINAGLGKETGSFAAALVSFAVGTLALTAIVVLSGKAGGLSGAANVQWYYLLGGLLGAAYVFTALVLVDEIGAGGVAAATVTGQLTAVGRARPPRRPRSRGDPDHLGAGARRRPAAGGHLPDRALAPSSTAAPPAASPRHPGSARRPRLRPPGPGGRRFGSRAVNGSTTTSIASGPRSIRQWPKERPSAVAAGLPAPGRRSWGLGTAGSRSS